MEIVFGPSQESPILKRTSRNKFTLIGCGYLHTGSLKEGTKVNTKEALNEGSNSCALYLKGSR